MSARAAAKKAGISSGRWYQLEKGVQKAGGGHEIPVGTTPSTVVAVARAVGWDIEDALKTAGFENALPVEATLGGSGSLTARVVNLAELPIDALLDEIRRRFVALESVDHSEHWPGFLDDGDPGAAVNGG